jgi:hypothetical protein
MGDVVECVDLEVKVDKKRVERVSGRISSWGGKSVVRMAKSAEDLVSRGNFISG